MFSLYRYVTPDFDIWSQEHAAVFLLDSECRVLETLSFAGSPDSVQLPVREIILRALQSECHGLILHHNHPSGASDPSPADIEVTRMFCRVLVPLGIKMIDHIIDGSGESFSFRANGLL